MRLLKFTAGLLFLLAAPVISAQSRVVTGDATINAMHELAQREITANQVESIKDWAYNNEQSIPCHCFETGEKWHFVWTRDLAYAADLSLARVAPDRVRNGLIFKAGRYRDGRSNDVIVAQDTGSGGSWPISTDRVVWFLASRHLDGDPAFNALQKRALTDTLAQDREFAFDPMMGLYRGETSFLDWREQTYPTWTSDNVTFIGESFALSTNVLHYMALRQAGATYATQAAALKERINDVFWDAGRQTLRSVVGPAYNPLELAEYDLLGISLAILADVLPPERARLALRNYPAAPFASPVIWPQQPDVPIYHNRAMWPFVSAYALRAARKVGDVRRTHFEFDSILRAASMSGSNMENYEITSLKAHVEDGKLSGPVVNSPRQLWSVAGMVSAVEEGVFGVQMDGRVAPTIPVAIARKAFGKRGSIELHQGKRVIRLLRPLKGAGNVWVEQSRTSRSGVLAIQLKAAQVKDVALIPGGAAFAAPMPTALPINDLRVAQQVTLPERTRLYRNGVRVGTAGRYDYKPQRELQCFSATAINDEGLESLPSAPQCHAQGTVRGDLGTAMKLDVGHHRLVLRFNNANGPINTGITAAVKKLRMTCDGRTQSFPIVMPHSVREQDSTSVIFALERPSQCSFVLQDGVNMSDLTVNARYTGGKGGVAGRLNEADYGDLLISPLDWASIPKVLKK